MPQTARPFLLAIVLGALIAPAAAQASPSQTSIMMDDDLLVYRGDQSAGDTLKKMKQIGVDTVRVTVLWKVVADGARPTAAEIRKLKGRAKTRARRQARRFRAANPATYPIGNWDRYDQVVRRAGELGIHVYFNVTGPGPRWAHEVPPRSKRSLASTYKPKAGAFKLFVTAVGKRYSGTYKDENGGVLPRVSFWSLWNEPNQGGWLTPQWERRGGTIVPASPALYRKLYQLGYKGLLASGHHPGTDIILLGETAPLGASSRSPRSPMRPAQFLRELACIAPDGTPYSGRAAALRDCGAFATRGPLVATGYAHHPYTKNVPPTVADPNPDSITMANIGSLGTLLDDLSAKTQGAIPSGLPLYMTEFGFETNPPDPFSGVPLAAQALYDTVGEYQAWSNPRILGQAQFLLRDVAPVRNHPKTSKAYWFTYQSGLYFRRGIPKPAARAYALPFLAIPAGTDPTTGAPRATLWGQLRFLPNGVADTAQIQWAPKGTSSWVNVGDPVPIDATGYFTTTLTAPAPGGQWHAIWLLPSGGLGQYSDASG